MRSKSPNPIIILTIIIVAIVLALGLFLALMFVQSRPPEGTSQVTVEGTDVMIDMNPNDAVMLVDSPGQGGEATAVPPIILPTPTDTPLPPPTATPLPPTAVANQVIFVSHTVGGADTLFSLSNQYNTTIPLMARFGISSADLIPGNVIAIAVANPAFCPGRRPYVVGEGESAFGISQAAGITLEEFRQINNLDANYTIHFTDVVCLP
ncbi:MAG: LysM peptidoglycan-binding domain-containing protein [Chloroflexi bacterium]|nr:LysM peptidoglycan-binding domain-containing protein [Chloroflexota bacterium]